MFPLGRRLAAQGYHVFAPDLPGFGRTPAPPDAPWPAGPNVQEQTDQLIGWMDAVGIYRAVLFGHSLGTQVLTEFAVRQPDRVHRLILAGPTPDPAFRSPSVQYGGLVMNMPFEAPSLVSVMQADYASAGISRMVQQLRRTCDDPIELRLPRLEAPTLVVRGEFDQTLSQPWAEEVARLIPDARMVVIEGSGHAVQYNAPQATALLIESFLEGELEAAGHGQVVVPASDGSHDPLAPPQPLSAGAHASLDYASALACLIVPRAFGWSRPTQNMLAFAGLSSLLTSLFTDYELGAVRKAPMTAHLSFDAASGMNLLFASLWTLRRQPPTESLPMN